MADVRYQCPSPVMGCALRITRLNQCGVPLDPLATNSRIQTRKFSMVKGTPVIEDSKEIMQQNACSEIDVLFYTPKRLKAQDVSLVITRVELPIIEMLLDATLLEDPDSIGDFRGFVLRNSLTAPSPNPKMLEVQATNANREECGLGGEGSAAVYRHLWPWTFQWEIDGDLTVDLATPFTIAFKGKALNNPQWFPSFPSADFPSWDPGGGSTATTNEPTGPPPAVIPSGFDPDPWTLQDQADIQAGGTYAGITEASYFPVISCDYANAGS